VDDQLQFSYNPIKSLRLTLVYLLSMRLFVLIILISCLSLFQETQAQQQSLPTPFENDATGNWSASYDQVITYYKNLESAFPNHFQFVEAGETDIGKPLHLGIISETGIADINQLREEYKTLIFINNGIHPGEPAGIDATMMWARDLLKDDDRRKKTLSQTSIVFVPVYNVGGALNRSGFSRANQNGPEKHGFRGNARNLDLNRDFVKADSKNAQSLNQILTTIRPHVFIDNHTTNGADYQYTLTLISTQYDKLGGPLGDYLEDMLDPWLYDYLARKGTGPTPYVYARGTPDDGIFGFLDTPRYSSGYAALHNSMSFISETHMFKPFKDRVSATYQFMDAVAEFARKNSHQIREAQREQINFLMATDSLSVSWKLNPEKADSILFKGYEAEYEESNVTGHKRLKYDREKPFTQTIPYYNTYKADVKVKVPEYYIIPQAWTEVLERLRWNQVEMRELENDTTIHVTHYYIEDYETTNYPYEGHYLHSDVQIRKKTREWKFYAGDVVVNPRQPAIRYIIETLEPRAHDSFFAWNFFDSILQQKEYFSSYVFEETAEELLSLNPKLKEDFETKQREDSAFAASPRAQLNYLYKRSPYYEKTHKMYPVARLE
jgi:hypothetical protein